MRDKILTPCTSPIEQSAPKLERQIMAKAKYHKSQRVLVKPVGTWAYVEAVVPKWIKGLRRADQYRL